MTLPDALMARLVEHRAAGDKLADTIRKKRSEHMAAVRECDAQLEALGHVPPDDPLAPATRFRRPGAAPVRAALVGALQDGPLRIRDLAKRLGRTESSTRSTVRDACSQGYVERVEQGKYGLPSGPKTV